MKAWRRGRDRGKVALPCRQQHHSASRSRCPSRAGQSCGVSEMSRDPRVEQEELGKAITPQVTHHRGWENQRSLDVAFNSTPPMS